MYNVHVFTALIWGFVVVVVSGFLAAYYSPALAIVLLGFHLVYYIYKSDQVQLQLEEYIVGMENRLDDLSSNIERISTGSNELQDFDLEID